LRYAFVGSDTRSIALPDTRRIFLYRKIHHLRAAIRRVRNHKRHYRASATGAIGDSCARETEAAWKKPSGNLANRTTCERVVAIDFGETAWD
jgi:hypothetical protein